MAKTLAELSAQAEKLYKDFVDSWDQHKQTHNVDELEDLIPYTDDYDLEYLDEVAHKSGHCDEQILRNKFEATDENGDYVNRMYTEIN